MQQLPVIHDPLIKLSPNKDKALKIFNQKLKKLRKSQKDREGVISSEKKLEELLIWSKICLLTNNRCIVNILCKI